MREAWTTTILQRELQKEGLGYRRENILQDLTHMYVTGLATTPEGRERVESFYEHAFLPFQEAHDLTRPEMGELMSAFKREIEPPEELTDLVNEWDEWTEITGT